MNRLYSNLPFNCKVNVLCHRLTPGVIYSSFLAVSQSVRIPVLIGSGVTHDNLERYMEANGMIIGSHFKEGGHWSNAVDPQRVKRLMSKRSSLQRL